MESSTGLISLVVVVILACCATALDSGEVDPSNTVGFIKEDNQRDTISLLISCFATLGLCVYSAVHLNVPRKAERSYWTLLKEFRWCIIGLFAPELILYTAWRQLASARQLRFEIGQASKNGPNGSLSNKKVVKHDNVKYAELTSSQVVVTSEESAQRDAENTPWTIAHGFYGSMGGFAIDNDESSNQYGPLFGDIKRLTLTAKGVALLAHCGHIPDISLDDIKDKNKADGLAKLLVCIQAGWMIIQVISRAATKLPITLLEVHVVAHVVCALIMYAIWWHKPRQVTSPTLLQGDWVWPLAAYMYLASRMSGAPPVGKLGRFRNATPELKNLAYFEDGGAIDKRPASIHRLGTANTLSDGRFALRPATQDLDEERVPTSPTPENEIELTRRRLAAEAVTSNPYLRSRFTRPANDTAPGGIAYSIPYATELVQVHSLDWPNAGLLRRTQSLIMGMVLWSASMAYGAIHVAAWNYFFPTTLEQLFWRLSSVWATFCAAFWLFTHLLAYFIPMIDRIWVSYNERKLGWFSTIIITTLCILCGVSYIASRAYLVVEAFASIREVPKGVYETPAWSQVFPHL
jgi:hypothetical protein